MNIFYADKSFEPSAANPFDNNLPYTDHWIMLKLLNTADFKQFTGGGMGGVFRLIITKENIDWPYRLHDFIQYESTYGKNIILAVDKEDLEYAQQIYENHNYMDKFLRPHEPRMLMHTTSKENYASIMQDGCLKSWNLLKNLGAGKEEKPIGHLLGDPSSYSDYIMFADGGVSAECIVLSKQKSTLEMNIDTPYIAGARFYFDAQKIAEDGLLVRDGAHLKVKDRLPIDKYIIWIATPDVLNISENTTPRIFAEKADMTFARNHRLPADANTGFL
ncbi:MAG: hypothetical protein FWD03_04220 [Defluviitaleaceae bacterium]|nr:hypothetical protein [Defluviitaleaceae bacterium]